MRLIDADALTNDILRRWNTNDDTDFANKEVWRALEGAPTIDVEPVRHGKWIDKSGGIEGAWNYCSVCGEQAIELYDYCPNCGAKMDE